MRGAPLRKIVLSVLWPNGNVKHFFIPQIIVRMMTGKNRRSFHSQAGRTGGLIEGEHNVEFHPGR